MNKMMIMIVACVSEKLAYWKKGTCRNAGEGFICEGNVTECQCNNN